MIRLYVIAALLIASLSGVIYVQNLRHTVATQQTRIVDLEASERNLKASQAVLEAVQAKRLEDTRAVGAIKENIARAEDDPLPDAIERALSGLRNRTP